MGCSHSVPDHDRRLIHAAEWGLISETRELLEDHEGVVVVNVNVTNHAGLTPLHIASARGRLVICKLLIQNGANPSAKAANNNDSTPLHKACIFDHLEVAKLLIDNDADVNAKGSDGKTPIFRACQMPFPRRLEVAKLLVENGANMNAQTNTGKTALHLACEKCHVKVAKFLIENGADVNVKDEDGWTPLHWACWTNNNKYGVHNFFLYGNSSFDEDDCEFDLVKVLLSGGANVIATTIEGSTPLHIACQENHMEIVWLLVRQYPWLISDWFLE